MDSLLKEYFGNIPVQKLLAKVFCVLLLLSLVSAAWLLISSGNRIVSRVVTDGANATIRQATLEIRRFLGTPAIIGQSVQNALRADYIDLNDRDSLTRFFFQLPQRNADYGVSGVYIADQRGVLSALDSDLRDGAASWYVLHASPDTDGKLNKHTVSSDGATDTLLEAGERFDATQRPWFEQAVASTESIWTPVYRDAHTGQPVMTWALAIRNARGQLEAVVGVDLLLSRISQFLEQLPVSENTAVLLTDRNGELIGDHMPAADVVSDRLAAWQILQYLTDFRGGLHRLKRSMKTMPLSMIAVGCSRYCRLVKVLIWPGVSGFSCHCQIISVRWEAN